MFITEAGMIGKMGEVGFVNNGIEVSVERCKMRLMLVLMVVF
jgi:hypothetical protein